MNAKEKKQLLVRYVELLVFNGVDITEMVGRPLGYYDFTKIQQGIEKYTMEKDPSFDTSWYATAEDPITPCLPSTVNP